ncbi:hypothetical protein [Streptomyces sp. NPDC008121]|uniref:hypothetical protein n=1 Tax=Streptomyces sp. NPDC008121 TaxID=3364809 RepID=UPI0036ED4A35
MAAPAATPTRRRPQQQHRRLHTHGLMLPVVLGVIYGLYTSTVARAGGPATWQQAVLGVVSAVALAGAVYALRRWQRTLPREPRAAAWAALAGIATGFLFSLSNASVLSAVVLSLFVAFGAFCVAFYTFYTHEDATGHPTR